ncbi:MAG: hypothetical protein WKG03_20805 [Telluria sp.]
MKAPSMPPVLATCLVQASYAAKARVVKGGASSVTPCQPVASL